MIRFLISLACTVVLIFGISAAGFTAPQKVYIGVYLNDISGFDLPLGRFQADLYVWCKWAGGTNTPPIRFVNGEIDRMTMDGVENDGNWHSILWHVQGTFRGTFPLQRFPFDRQTLKIQIEIPGDGYEIMPDLAGSGMSQEFSITGWNYEPYFTVKLHSEHYYSDFGSVLNEGEPWIGRSVYFSVQLSRPFTPYFLKFILPLTIILLITLSVFFTKNNIEANLAVGITALLTSVALHSSLTDSLPNVSYMVSADKFFIFSYLVIMVNIASSVTGFNFSEMKESLGRKINSWGWKITAGVIIAGMSLILAVDSYHALGESYKPLPKPPPHATSKTEAVFYVPKMNTLTLDGIYQGLIARGLIHTDEAGNPVPFLITSIPSLTNDLLRFYPDGSVSVKWQLKPDVFWSDGTPITSQDLYFSILLGDDSNRIDVEIEDDKTIEVFYRKKSYSILEEFRLYPKHFCEPYLIKHGKDDFEKQFDTNSPPLDGPFMVQEFVPGKYAVFIRNPYFPGDTPSLEKITIHVTNKVFDQLAKAGKTDALWNLGVQTFETIKGYTNLTIYNNPSGYLYLLQPDCNTPPFDNPLFRKGLMYAIDRAKIAQLLFGDDGKVPDSYRPEFAPDFQPGLPHYGYDPQKAKAIFAQFGYNIAIKLYASTGVMKSAEAPVILAVRAYLENAGLKVILMTNASSAANLFNEGNHGGLVYVNRQSQFSKPLYFWKYTPLPPYLKQCSENFTASLYDERRLELSKVMQKIFAEEVPVISLAFGADRGATQNNLKQWKPGENSGSHWWNVEYWYFE
ncbi:MAG: hypothetical protein A2Y33_00160 [Spirochaetes bacterium GWF1_51_8]|nr:MAG: hypothetical protein A2Y33_00160 [Spirochaetes bacterium GWF1_51_8]